MLKRSLLKKYTNISLINFTIVAVIGLLMRYKIGFEFPYLEQKNLLHAHSHFAFSGWITHTLYLFIFNILSKEQPGLNLKQYIWMINGNLVCSYGMLISFAFRGYDFTSILFSTFSLFFSFGFAIFYFNDTFRNKTSFAGHAWFTAALIFSILSSVGTLSLGYMMSSGNINLDLYLSSVYYYLHFQYNGLFFFSCMGLLLWKITSLVPEFSLRPVIFKLFAISCIPCFFLSVLWLNIPDWLFVVVVLSAATQFFAFILFIKSIISNYYLIQKQFSPFIQMLLLFAGLALSVKISLQLFSTIPALSELAFGFRTIVIAYLHLVLLAFVSMFLLAYIFIEKLVVVTKASMVSMVIISGGIFMNELILLIQGVASFTYTLVPYANVSLVVVSGIIFIGVLFLLICSFWDRKNFETDFE